MKTNFTYIEKAAKAMTILKKMEGTIPLAEKKRDQLLEKLSNQTLMFSEKKEIWVEAFAIVAKIAIIKAMKSRFAILDSRVHFLLSSSPKDYNKEIKDFLDLSDLLDLIFALVEFRDEFNRSKDEITKALEEDKKKLNIVEALQKAKNRAQKYTEAGILNDRLQTIKLFQSFYNSMTKSIIIMDEDLMTNHERINEEIFVKTSEVFAGHSIKNHWNDLCKYMIQYYDNGFTRSFINIDRYGFQERALLWCVKFKIGYYFSVLDLNTGIKGLKIYEENNIIKPSNWD